MNAPADRTKGHAVMEATFAAEYAELHEKLWSHLDTGLSLALVAAGSVALLGIALPKGWELVTPACGVLLAILGALQVGLKPRERSITFRDTRRKLEDLVSVSGDLPHPELERNLSKLLSDAPRGLEALTTPAQNRALARHGYPQDPLNGWERFFARCAS